MAEGNLINNGVRIQAIDQASSRFRQIGSTFQGMSNTIFNGLRRMPNETQRAFRPFDGVKRLFRTDLTRASRQGFDQMDAQFQAFNTNIRRHVNTFNSIVMGGVAIAMSGMGIRRAGQAITGMIGGWVQQAEDFERVMRQVKFLGQVSTDEYAALTDRIMDLGIALPTSSLKVAEGTLDALRLGFGADEAEFMAEPVAMMEFFSEGMLSTADSAQFLNAVLKQINATAHDTEEILDMLMATSRHTAFTIDELWRSWQSARAAPGGLALEGLEDLPDFLTLLGAGRMALTPRYAGRVVNSFVRAMHQAAASEGARGDLWAELGLDLSALEDGRKGPVEVLEYLGEKSREIWGEGQERRQALQRMLGVEALPIIDAFDAYARQTDDSLANMRDSIKESMGFSEEYMDELLHTAYGVRTVLTGTIETLTTLLGELYFPILVPMMQHAQTFFEYVINFVREYPAFARILGIIVGLVGTLGVISGILMLIFGQIFSIYGSLANVSIQLAALKVQSAEALGMLGLKSATVGNLLRKQVIPPLQKIGSMLWRFAMMSGLIYLTWRYDFLQIRSTVTRVMDNVRRSFDDAGRAIENLSGAGLHTFMEMRTSSENFWERFTGWITVAKVMWDGFTQGLRSFVEEGRFLLSDTVMARLLGVTKDQLEGINKIDPTQSPLLLGLTNVFIIVNMISTTWQGFVDGLREAGEVMRSVFDPIFRLLEGLMPQLDLFEDTDGDLLRPNLDAWEDLGNTLGTIFGYVMGIKLALFAWRSILAPVGRSVHWIGKTLGGLGIGKVTGLGKKIGGLLGLVGLGGKDTAKGMIRPPRVYDVAWQHGKPEGISNLSGIVRQRDPATLMHKLFGSQVYDKYGNLLGREAGRLGKIGAGIKGSKNIPVLGILATLLSGITASPGERVQDMGATGLGAGGATLGAIAGTAIAPGPGTGVGAIVGKIIGGITGALIASPIAPIFGEWLQTNWDAAIDFARGRISYEEFLNIMLDALLTASYRIGELIGNVVFEIEGIFWSLWDHAILVRNRMIAIVYTIYESILNLAMSIVEFAILIRENPREALDVVIGKIGEFVSFIWDLHTAISSFLHNIGQHWAFQAFLAPMQTARGIIDQYRGRREEEGTGPTRGIMSPDLYAKGGHVSRPTNAILGEDGDEVVIPLSEKYRERGKRLWEQAGKRIGEGSGEGSSVFQFNDGAIQINVQSLDKDTDIRKAAKKMYKEFIRLSEEDKMRNYRPVRER